MLRYKDEADAPKLDAALKAAKTKNELDVSLEAILTWDETNDEVKTFQEIYGDAANDLRQGILNLAERFPQMREHAAETKLKGPCIEGVAYYPQTDNNLRLTNGRPMWVAGDATGKFRGIVASMISGEYIADEILADYQKSKGLTANHTSKVDALLEERAREQA